MQKNKKYWLRGGIILGTVYAIIFIIYIFFAYQTEGKAPLYAGGAGFGLALIPIVFSSLPISLLLEEIGKFLPIYFNTAIGSVFILFICGVVQWFIWGLISGYLYGKYKNKNI